MNTSQYFAIKQSLKTVFVNKNYCKHEPEKKKNPEQIFSSITGFLLPKPAMPVSFPQYASYYYHEWNKTKQRYTFMAAMVFTELYIFDMQPYKLKKETLIFKDLK